MAEERRTCAHPRVKVIAQWVEPDSVNESSCAQWFHCEACGKYWRERRSRPLPKGARLSDVAEVEAAQAHLTHDDGRLHLGWRPIVLVIALQSLVLAAMLWFIFASFH